MIVKITARAWSLRILALLHDGVPGRQAALLAACDAGRTAFAQSLRHLIDLGLLERNPGHGHPLRPEFRLTEQGRAAAAMAAGVVTLAPNAGDQAILRRSWTLPILIVARQPRSFSQVKSSLGQITDRALSQSLSVLEDQTWLSRRVDVDARPPRPLYQAQRLGAQIGNAAQLPR